MEEKYSGLEKSLRNGVAWITKRQRKNAIRKIGNIEKYVENYNSSGGKYEMLKKIGWSIPYFLVVGSSPHGVQQWAWDKFKLFTPRTSTNTNAIGFGLAFLGMQTYFMLEAGDAVIHGNVADWIDVAYDTVVLSYYGLVGVAQSSTRLGYTNTNWFRKKEKGSRIGKGAWSISGSTLLWNGPYFICWAGKKGYDALRRRKKEKERS